jgi:hypothetical protein
MEGPAMMTREELKDIAWYIPTYLITLLGVAAWANFFANLAVLLKDGF